MKVYLTLADGSVFPGESVSNNIHTCGMLSFSLTEFAFEETVTNPANIGKIIMFTFPIIGAMGINYEDNLSDTVTIQGVICKENSDIYSNFRAKTSIKEYLNSNNKVYASSFDTRAILLHLREFGEMPAVISDKPYSKEDVLKEYSNLNKDYKPINSPINSNKKIKAKIFDLGASKTFYKMLDGFGIYNSDEDYNLIVISNATTFNLENDKYVDFIKENKGKKFIAFGDANVLLAKAFGLEYKSLGLGHHGGNIPIKNVINNKDYITGQNHLWYIPKQDKIEVVFNNIHDNSTEAYISKDLTFAGFNFKPMDITITNTLNMMGVN